MKTYYIEGSIPIQGDFTAKNKKEAVKQFKKTFRSLPAWKLTQKEASKIDIQVSFIEPKKAV